MKSFEAPVTPYEAGFEGFSEPVSGNMCCRGVLHHPAGTKPWVDNQGSACEVFVEFLVMDLITAIIDALAAVTLCGDSSPYYSRASSLQMLIGRQHKG